MSRITVNRFGYIVSSGSLQTIVSMQQSATPQLTHQKITTNERNKLIDKMYKHSRLFINEKTGVEECALPMAGMKHLVNLMVDENPLGGATIEFGMELLETMYEMQAPDYTTKKAVLCAMCAGKVGVKRCAACPEDSEIRYCSRVCQVAAWPLHKKAECAGCRGEDVE